MTIYNALSKQKIHAALICTTITRWTVARVFAPKPPKTKRFYWPLTERECIECNETWRGRRLINYLFIGVYFISCDCYCDVLNDVQIWLQKETPGKKW